MDTFCYLGIRYSHCAFQPDKLTATRDISQCVDGLLKTVIKERNDSKYKCMSLAIWCGLDSANEKMHLIWYLRWGASRRGFIPDRSEIVDCSLLQHAAPPSSGCGKSLWEFTNARNPRFLTEDKRVADACKMQKTNCISDWKYFLIEVKQACWVKREPVGPRARS